ncbi:PTS sugar transporter subunit IIB [Sporolactobacillus shoreicorticis]|uniref:PTS system mannose/fructose/N-acetylgalactosamine-transporter subunit IIB n=1 Tax=Sporolactobacillus shoreicorticis TaxID=1923877 RepID=A0ABW5S0M1_9BACL|nr:PTS sugar transporter subunit IIB [Sporolactobacillus shoreicorticis]MCO7124662.1 PTS sugar transporter subunit IIB [Sporolactobacillus shoreicorticis]
MARIDDRLIHGQVAVMWSKQLNVSRIIVVSDEVAKNELQVSALKMAAPASIQAFVFPVDKAATLINDPRSEKMRILVVTNTPDDLYRLLTKIHEKPDLNIANYGRVAGNLESKEKITDTVYVGQNDKEIFNKLFELGFDFSYQPLPSDSKKSLKKLMGGN